MRKKVIISFFALLLISFSFVSCRCGTTVITQHATNHVFSAGEAIHIYDIESRDHLATLTLTRVAVIIDEPFVITTTVEDEDGNDIVTEREFAQVIQVFYTFVRHNTNRPIAAGNFTTRGSAGGETAFVNSGTSMPRVTAADFAGADMPTFALIARTDGETGYFTVAAGTVRSHIDITYRWNIVQRLETARIRMAVPQLPDNGSNGDVSENEME